MREVADDLPPPPGADGLGGQDDAAALDGHAHPGPPGPAGHVVHQRAHLDLRGAAGAVLARQGLGADDVQVARGPHRDLAVDAAEVPPHAVAVAVEAGRPPVGEVGTGAPGGHPDRELVGAAPQPGQRGLERHVVARVAGDLAAVQVDGGVVAGALEAHHPACAAGLAGEREGALVPADPRAVGARLARVPVVREGDRPPAVVTGVTEVPRAAQRQPPGLALAHRRPPARGRGVRRGRGHRAGPGQRTERRGDEDGGEQYAAFHRDDDHSPATPALRNLHLRAKCES